MKVGFIGAGRVGCSIGKYFTEHGIAVAGYYSRSFSSAQWAADFTGSQAFKEVKSCVLASDILMIAVPDDKIREVWESIKSFALSGKVICHFSGCLSSKIFQGVEQLEAFACSLHPIFAFSDKKTAFQQLEQVNFTIEGAPYAVTKVRQLMSSCQNRLVEIETENKTKYHAAASLLSNHVVALLATGYELLEEAGISEQDARSLTASLVAENVSHIIQEGTVHALTGPIERNDTGTVEKHLKSLNEEQKEIYQVLGKKVLKIAMKKNPGIDYNSIKKIL